MARFMALFGATCSYCSIHLDLNMSWNHNASTVDHIVCRSSGGTDEMSNLTVCCRACNSLKTHIDVDVWRASRGYALTPIKTFADLLASDTARVKYKRITVAVQFPEETLDRVWAWIKAHPHGSQILNKSEAIRKLVEAAFDSGAADKMLTSAEPRRLGRRNRISSPLTQRIGHE